MDSFSFTSRFSLMTGAGRLAVVSLAVLALATGCLPRGTNEAGRFAPEEPLLDSDQPVTFDRLKAAVFEKYDCLRCHGNLASEAGTLRWVQLNGPADQSPLYSRIADGTMPGGGVLVPSSALGLVARYIVGVQAQGAPTPSPSPSESTPPDETPNFANLKRRVLEPTDCILCHDDMATEEGLAKYVSAGKPEESSLYLRIVDDTMPPAGPLSEADRVFVRRYIEALPSPSPSP